MKIMKKAIAYLLITTMALTVNVSVFATNDLQDETEPTAIKEEQIRTDEEAMNDENEARTSEESTMTMSLKKESYVADNGTYLM